MENENIPQPLDELMTKLGLTNADLVRASTEQLSFKMVQKGRKGRRLTPNMQAKILAALLAVKPDLNLRPRDLFRYEMGLPQSVEPKIEEKKEEQKEEQKAENKPKKKSAKNNRKNLSQKARHVAKKRLFRKRR